MSAISYRAQYIYLPAASQVIKIFFLALRRERKYKNTLSTQSHGFNLGWCIHTKIEDTWDCWNQGTHCVFELTCSLPCSVDQAIYLYLRRTHLCKREGMISDSTPQTRVNRLIEWVSIDKTRLLIGNQLVSSFQMFQLILISRMPRMLLGCGY